VALASCGGSDSKSSDVRTVGTTEVESDAAILNALLDMEHASIVAYEASGSRLDGPVLGFLQQERRHADALAKAITALGRTPEPPRPRAEYEGGFPTLRGRRDALSFALDVESTAIAAYADALGKIATDSVRVTCASILATESEHSAVLLGALGRPQVPQAFVTGPPPEPETP
jgi:rubrerythrin